MLIRNLKFKIYCGVIDVNKIIKNCNIVNADKTFISDIYIEDGIIKLIEENINIPDIEIIDAQGKYVIPGGVDVHTHLNLDVGIARAQDDFYTGTVAAACGGTTTIVDHMGFGPKGCNLKHQVDVYHGYAQGKAVIDYSFHGVFQHLNKDILNEIKSIIDDEGIPSFKAYFTYGFKMEDCEVLQILRELKEQGGLLTVHPENDSVVNFLSNEYFNAGKIAPVYHERSRPAQCEADVINRAILLADMAGNAPLYIVHLSNELGLQYIKMAQNRGQRVLAETCPQYLFLDDSMYEKPNLEGLNYICSPPIRNRSNQMPLWNGMIDGSISTFATDHCPFSSDLRIKMASKDFRKCPGGLPGIELRLSLLFTEGVKKNKITMNKFVDLCSTKPAKIMGLYPKKGIIAVGSDADIVIFDPDKESTATHANLHENVDYTPYEGIKLQGAPTLTMLRGEVIVKDNVFIGRKGSGQFIKRSKFNYC